MKDLENQKEGMQTKSASGKEKEGMSESSTLQNQAMLAVHN
jgi:hypothetical protein